MKTTSAYFLGGMVSAILLMGIVVWFGRLEILRELAIGYDNIEKPIQLLTRVKLIQDGQQVGELYRGAIVSLDGRAEDSPMEYFSCQIGWENRGVKRELVYQIHSNKSAPLIEMKTPFDKLNQTQSTGAASQ